MREYRPTVCVGPVHGTLAYDFLSWQRLWIAAVVWVIWRKLRELARKDKLSKAC